MTNTPDPIHALYLDALSGNDDLARLIAAYLAVLSSESVS